MSITERAEIFSKEYLTIEDMQKLLGLDYDTAAKVIREIRRKNDRLGIQGKIHVQDYFDYYNIPMSDRYVVHFEKLSEEKGERWKRL